MRSRFRVRGVLSIGLFAVAARLAAAPCSPSETALCLNGGRFQAAVHWQDSRGRSGEGQAIALTADTGYFWFFSPSNIELVVKVLDARSVNGKFWVFFGALSNVQYDLTVTDSATGSVKTYHNAQGQFASVGDTEAFAGSVEAPPLNDAIDVTGSPASESLAAVQDFIDASLARTSPKDAAALTPCPAAADEDGSLFLAGCRFRVEVHWTDSHGRHGAGQPVHLTGDTGYFWFFSPTNVELMVKVLDARPVNGKFWVFFGALSNVEYTVNVVDTLSGAVRSYENPQGAFASVGDTTAFRGGFGVTIETDDGRAQSGLVTAEAGGALSVTAADGTVFSLVVPPSSVFRSEEIRMIPVRSVGAFPFAQPLAAGVELEPHGLVLVEGATLTVHTPTAIPPAEETAVAWNGSGQDFFLYPPSPSGGDLELFITHFAGYGVAHATAAERDAQKLREPVDDVDLFKHQIAPSLRQARAEAAAATVSRKAAADWHDEAKATLDASFGWLFQAILLASGEPSTAVSLVRAADEWVKTVEVILGPVNLVWPGRQTSLDQILEGLMRRAIDRVHTRCFGDPLSIHDLPMLIAVSNRHGFDVARETAAAIKCLTFAFTFESTIAETTDIPRRGTVQQTETAVAELTLAPQYTDGWIQLSGSDFIEVEDISLVGPGGCEISTDKAPDTFTARMIWPSWTSTGGAPRLVLEYNTGAPTSLLEETCPNESEPRRVEDLWYLEYYQFHREGAEINSYEQGGWKVSGKGDPWATTQTSGGDHGVTESTKFTLRHTPK